ncbi:MAG: alpha/beta hydrolase [Marmoricola sp.]|nr:alpha/beta hydrolase [Marmoricola sp.]
MTPGRPEPRPATPTSGPTGPTRRTVLRAGLVLPAAGVLGAAAACGPSSGGRAAGPTTAPASSASPARGTQRLFYGPDHDQQLLDVRRPTGAPGPSAPSARTVVLVHGGYWQSSYGLDLMVPLAERLTSRGHVTVNVEYRRVGSGGGWPATFTDVAAALDLVSRRDDLPREVVVVGHSAGGHLAAWAASRTGRTPGGAPAGRLLRALSLSGLLDLTAAAAAPESGGATRSLMGGGPEEHPERYRLGDPALLTPATCPVVAVQAADERVIPTDQAADYVRVATRAAGRASAVTVPGDHFTLIDPDSAAWRRIQGLVEG